MNASYINICSCLCQRQHHTNCQIMSTRRTDQQHVKQSASTQV